MESKEDILSEMLVKAVIDSISEVQSLNNRERVYYVDYKRAMMPKIKELSEAGHSDLNHITIEAYLVKAYVEEKYLLYANEDFSQYSIYEKDGFTDWPTAMALRFPGYKFDQSTLTIENSEDSSTIDFEDLKSLLLSTSEDTVSFKAFQSITAIQSIFLNSKVPPPKVLYASFMRSGSTLFRKYLESITGIATGSIYPNNYTMNFSLLSSGFKGETHTGNDIWIFKAHHPFLFSQASNPGVHKVMVCVRNPLDVIASFWHLRLTQTHTKSGKIVKQGEDD